jgi:threonine dehydratase
MFPIAQAYVDEVVLVSDEAIIQAQQALWSVLRIVAEPGGAAAVAALMSHGYRPAPGERIGVLISGGNTTGVNFGKEYVPYDDAEGGNTRNETILLR